MQSGIYSYPGRKYQRLVVLFVLAFVSGNTFAGDGAAEEGAIVFGLGPATERDLKSKSNSYGVALRAERTIVEHRLEIEVGVTRLTTAGRREMGVGVTFKRPFQLSPTTELMVGIGPQVVRKFDAQERGTSLGIEAALDLMVWPTESKDIGWYIEPSYGFGPGNKKAERSLGASAGLLVRWP